MDHYQSHIHLSIYNELMKTVPSTFDAKVMGMKPCILNDVFHILKELECTFIQKIFFLFTTYRCGF